MMSLSTFLLRNPRSTLLLSSLFLFIISCAPRLAWGWSPENKWHRLQPGLHDVPQLDKGHHHVSGSVIALAGNSDIRLHFLPAGEPVPAAAQVVAQATFVDSLHTKSNFGKLRVVAKDDQHVGHELRYRAAGFAEGFLTAGAIWDHFRNTRDYFKTDLYPGVDIWDKPMKWLHEQEAWVMQQLAARTGSLSDSTPLGGSSSSSSSSSSSNALRILDCGCGSSHLTFGLWHYTRNVLGVETHITGVDMNAALMARSNQYCQELGMAGTDACFVASSILDYQPPHCPDIVLALHACDTATDEALALAIKQGAPVVMAVPCCHKHLHRQLSGSKGTLIPPFQPLMSQGIVRQRFLDLLTDTLRASILRIMGYQVDVIEFISTEHTPRNILIRATKSASSQSSAKAAAMRQAAVKEYLELRDFWKVVPHLETLIGDELALNA